MVKSVRVNWSMFGPEAPFDLIAGDLETELPAWRDGGDSVLDAVNVISARYFGDAAWERLFGLEATEAEILFQIAAPAHMAGSYEVALRRVTVAACKKISDPRLRHESAGTRVCSLEQA